MKLGIIEFKRIKPTGCQDDYCAGEDCNGNYAPSTVEKGKLYREIIFDMLMEFGASTVAGISQALDIPMQSVSSIIQKMVRNGKLVQGDKVIGVTGRSAFSYSAVS